MKGNKMILLKLISIALIAASLAACSQSSNSSSRPDDSHSVNYSIDGKTPDEYYKQFILRADPCYQGSYRNYHFIASSIGFLHSNTAFRFDVTVYLFADNTYIAELTQMKPSDQWQDTYIHVREFEQTGSWKIERMNIVLDGLGRGTPETYNGMSGFYLSLQKVKADPMFDGSSVNVHKVFSTSILQRLESSCQ